MSQKDTDDVLDFINSLPDSRGGTPADGKNSNDFLDFLDELTAHDKAAKPKPKLEPKKRDTPDATPRLRSVEADASAASNTASVGGGSEIASQNTNETHTGETHGGAAHGDETHGDETNVGQTHAGKTLTGETQQALGQLAESDPIASLSSWWSTEGSTKVSSLWGSLTSNAQSIGESTYQLASTTSQQLSHQRQKFLQDNRGVADTDQILHITDKLNAMLGSVSQQIKDGLMDKEDELLNILLVYDLTNLPYLDSLCAQKFNKVMGQVEGGIRTTVSNFNHKHEQRETERHVHLDMFHGKAIDGEKLCYANLDSSIKDYLKITQHENKDLVAENGINTSNVFIAIQPSTTAASDTSASEPGSVSVIEANSPDSFAFTMILRDITNNIKVVSKSQPFPLRWARWVGGDHADVTEVFGGDDVDPAEWVKEWVQDGLGLTFAVLAQEYVTRRMGV